jgi:hypothetical protein
MDILFADYVGWPTDLVVTCPIGDKESPKAVPGEASRCVSAPMLGFRAETVK